MDAGYIKPELVDYGTLADLTEATSFTEQEDGGSKTQIHHSTPSA